MRILKFMTSTDLVFELKKLVSLVLTVKKS